MHVRSRPSSASPSHRDTSTVSVPPAGTARKSMGATMTSTDASRNRRCAASPVATTEPSSRCSQPVGVEPPEGRCRGHQDRTGHELRKVRSGASFSRRASTRRRTRRRSRGVSHARASASNFALYRAEWHSSVSLLRAETVLRRAASVVRDDPSHRRPHPVAWRRPCQPPSLPPTLTAI